MEPDTYRRRRVMALIAGLGLIGLLAWAFGGGGGKTPTQPEGSTRTYHPVHAVSGSAVSGSAAASRHAAAPAASPGSSGSSGSARPLTPGLPSPSTDPAASPGGSASAGLGPGQLTSDGLCAPGAVVLSVFTTKPSYSGAQDPKFAVYAVSTAAGVCTFDLGPGKLHLEVMSSGRVIWDSGDCARSDSTWIARLRRGVPVLESITWNRTITLPGCVTLASSARAGDYQAQAWTASASSAVLSFRLVH